jgi:hypothetical protein
VTDYSYEGALAAGAAANARSAILWPWQRRRPAVRATNYVSSRMELGAAQGAGAVSVLVVDEQEGRLNPRRRG